MGMLIGLLVGGNFGAVAGGQRPLQGQLKAEDSNDITAGNEWSLRMDES